MTGILTNLGTALGSELIGRFFQGRDQKSLAEAFNAQLPQIQQAQAQNIQNFTNLLQSGGDTSQFQPAQLPQFSPELFQNPAIANQLISAAFGGGFGGNQLANTLATQSAQNNSFNNQRGLAGFNLTGDTSISDAIRSGQGAPVEQVLAGRSALDEAGVAGDVLVENTRFGNQKTLQDARLDLEKERLNLLKREVAIKERASKNTASGLKPADLRDIDKTADKRADNAIVQEFMAANPDGMTDIFGDPLSRSQIEAIAQSQPDYVEKKASFKARFINEIMGSLGAAPQQPPQQAPLQPVASGQQEGRGAASQQASGASAGDLNPQDIVQQAIGAIGDGVSQEAIIERIRSLGLPPQQMREILIGIRNGVQ